MSIQELPWSLYIDIEGFSSIYQKDSGKALQLLGKLIYDVYKIGTKIYFNENQELFANQLGDGLVITPSQLANDNNLIRPISIAIVLMRLTTLRGGTTRAAISSGNISDILGCYPKALVDNVNNACISLGMGLMTIFQVMGDALINSHKLSISGRENPKGPRLLVDSKLESALDSKDVKIVDKNNSHIEVNWIRTNLSTVDDIFKGIGAAQHSTKDIINALEHYISVNSGLSDEWKHSVKRLIKTISPSNL